LFAGPVEINLKPGPEANKPGLGHGGQLSGKGILFAKPSGSAQGHNPRYFCPQRMPIVTGCGHQRAVSFFL
jgi:hypothetical protein